MKGLSLGYFRYRWRMFGGMILQTDGWIYEDAKGHICGKKHPLTPIDYEEWKERNTNEEYYSATNQFMLIGGLVGVASAINENAKERAIGANKTSYAAVLSGGAKGAIAGYFIHITLPFVLAETITRFAVRLYQ
jgi:hypothetical protein